MNSAPDIRAAEITRALTIKQNNAIAAVLAGSALAGAATRLYGFGPRAFAPLAPLTLLLGVCVGVLYANAFEYLLHRFFLHWGNGFLVRRHALHHDSTGAPNEARYINFATSPWVAVLVITLNALPVFAGLSILEHWLRAGPDAAVGIAGIFATGIFGAGIFGGFTLYYVLYEEIHWRIHMDGWLPRQLGFARRHHLQHHGEAEGCYNIFLPIFDWLFARLEGKRGLPNPR